MFAGITTSTRTANAMDSSRFFISHHLVGRFSQREGDDSWQTRQAVFVARRRAGVPGVSTTPSFSKPNG
jgi:hypothetical protein